MERQGYRPSTIKSTIASLTPLSPYLHDPEQAKQFLAEMKICESRKVKIVYDLARYYKMKGIPFDKPRYRQIPRIPYVPLEKDLDALIAGLSKKPMTFCQILKETGARAGEVMALRWLDVDLERQTVSIQAEKNSKPRLLKLSNRLVGMLNLLPRDGKFVFHSDTIEGSVALSSIRRNFERQKKYLAEKTLNSNIQRITLHTFRHWRATQLYAQTKDILYVKEQLGHRSINSTLVYVQLQDCKSEDYHVKTAKNQSEATPLIEEGYQYVCTTPDQIMIFRKRK